MRNDPCPCGSGKKYKKCHGAAVPPEVAALPTNARAEWLRADVVLQRQKRLGQELTDWATKKLGAEWANAAFDAWGLAPDEDLSDHEADIWAAWSLFRHVPSAMGAPIGAKWLAESGARAGEDDRTLVEAALAMHFGLWEVETVEEGVGATVTDRLTGRTLFVHEPDLTFTLGPTEYLCAYVLEADGVHVFTGLHDDTLLQIDGQQLLADVLADAALAEPPVPAQILADATWQARVVRRFHAVAEAAYADLDEAAGPADDDLEDAR